MKTKRAKETAIRLRHGKSFLDVKGWEVSPALGVYKTAESGFAIVMMVSGYTLIMGLPSLDAAMTCCRLLLLEKKLYFGSPHYEDTWALVGKDAAYTLIEKHKRRTMFEKRKKA